MLSMVLLEEGCRRKAPRSGRAERDGVIQELLVQGRATLWQFSKTRFVSECTSWGLKETEQDTSCCRFAGERVGFVSRLSGHGVLSQASLSVLKVLSLDIINEQQREGGCEITLIEEHPSLRTKLRIEVCVCPL